MVCKVYLRLLPLGDLNLRFQCLFEMWKYVQVRVYRDTDDGLLRFATTGTTAEVGMHILFSLEYLMLLFLKIFGRRLDG